MDTNIKFEQIVENARAKFNEKFQLEGFSVEFVSSQKLREVLKVHFNDVFERQASRYQLTKEDFERSEALFKNYAGLHSDDIILRDEEGNFAGHFMGESEDYTTYYLRNAGLIPKWRRQKIASRFVDVFCEYLYDLGYSRVTSQHLGDNNAVLIMMLKFDFHIAGIETREEWGTLVKCVKHLVSERKNLFKSALSSQR